MLGSNLDIKVIIDIIVTFPCRVIQHIVNGQNPRIVSPLYKVC